jgi:plasmid maintenance system antidote protein VapI
MELTLETAIKAVQIYAESHPRPLHVTQKQAAEMLDRSEPTIRTMVRSGKLRLNDAGMIPISEVDRVLAITSSPSH